MKRCDQVQSLHSDFFRVLVLVFEAEDASHVMVLSSSHSDLWMVKKLLSLNFLSGCCSAGPVLTPLLTEFPPSSQRTSAKGEDTSLTTHARVALLDCSSSLDGGKMVRTGAGRAESDYRNTPRNEFIS